MDKDLIKKLADLLSAAPQQDRRELAERALLVANGAATIAEMESFAFDWGGTWNEPRKWGQPAAVK